MEDSLLLPFKTNSFLILLQILLVVFNLIIYLVSLRENEKKLLESDKNEKDFFEITH